MNHPTPGHMEGRQPGQPVELANYVAITRSPLIPASRPPEPTTMAKPGLGLGYVTLSGRAVKPEH